MLQSQPLEEVESFPYLGSEIGQSISVEWEVPARLEKAGKMYQMWRKKVFAVEPSVLPLKYASFEPGFVCAPLSSRDMEYDPT